MFEVLIYLLMALFARTKSHPSSETWPTHHAPWFGGLPLREDNSTLLYDSTEKMPAILPTPAPEEPAIPSLLSKPIMVSLDPDNQLSSGSSSSHTLVKKPMIISTYQDQGQGVASNFYIVAVPKQNSQTQNLSSQYYPPQTWPTTQRPRTIVEVVRSIELPVDQMPYGSETSNILTEYHVNDKMETDLENKKTKRSDESASTSLFRPETVNGFRSLFQLPGPVTEKKNTTKLEEIDAITGQNITGPVIVTKNPINIYVQDPGLIYLMHKQFKYPMEGISQTQEGY